MVVLGLMFWAIGERAQRRGIAGIALPQERFASEEQASAEAP